MTTSVPASASAVPASATISRRSPTFWPRRCSVGTNWPPCMEMTWAFATASDARDGLTRLLASYCSFVFDNPYLVQVLVSESGQLPEPERHRARAAQYAYIAEWVTPTRKVHRNGTPSPRGSESKRSRP